MNEHLKQTNVHYKDLNRKSYLHWLYFHTIGKQTTKKKNKTTGLYAEYNKINCGFNDSSTFTKKQQTGVCDSLSVSESVSCYLAPAYRIPHEVQWRTTAMWHHDLLLYIVLSCVSPLSFVPPKKKMSIFTFLKKNKLTASVQLVLCDSDEKGGYKKLLTRRTRLPLIGSCRDFW